MESADDSTVLGDFDNVSLTADGITSRFFRKDGKYFMNTQGPNGVDQDFEVLYTFGCKPLQQYLVTFPGGKMQVPRMRWMYRNGCTSMPGRNYPQRLAALDQGRAELEYDVCFLPFDQFAEELYA